MQHVALQGSFEWELPHHAAALPFQVDPAVLQTLHTPAARHSYCPPTSPHFYSASPLLTRLCLASLALPGKRLLILRVQVTWHLPCGDTFPASRT